MRTSRIIHLLKSIRQLGLRPLVLFALYKIGLLSGHYQRVERRSLQRQVPITKYRSLFTLPDRAGLLHLLGPDGKAALLAEADEIVSGRVRLFGGEPSPLQISFDQPLQHWTAYETNPRLLSTLQSPIPNHQFPTSNLPSSIPDIKFLWEPARFSFTFPLGRAYHLTQDETYAEAFWRHVETFLAGNPPYLGLHWMNGQEAGLRLMAFVWADHVFAASPASSAQRRETLRLSIAHHASRITPTLIYARSQNNNHLITEAAALYTAGLFLGNAKWRGLGWRWFNWCLQNQISGYGEYIQHSTNYHRLMLQTALWVNAVRSAELSPHSGPPSWPHASAQALARAAHWLFSMLDPITGRAPNLGSNDGSLIFPLSNCSFADFRPVVQAAARAFLKTQLSPGPWDEPSAWLGLAPADKTYEPGHYMTDNLRGRTSWAHLRASRFRSRLAHMDQLHLDLWWRGLNLAQDAGTYLYNADPPWDNPLGSTRVHNTVTVNGRDQMTRAGRFLTLDWFPAYSHTAFESDETVLQRVHAYHKGYRRFGVRHERTVTVYTDDRWRIDDTLVLRRPPLVTRHPSPVTRPPSPLTFHLHWLLPDWEWKLDEYESTIEMKLKSPHGWITLTIETSSLVTRPSPPVPRPPSPATRHPSPVTRSPSLVRAGELLFGTRDVLPIEGWVSPTYGVKIPALSLAVEVQSTGTLTFTSRFTFPE